jgi:hypothetical protein
MDVSSFAFHEGYSKFELLNPPEAGKILGIYDKKSEFRVRNQGFRSAYLDTILKKKCAAGEFSFKLLVKKYFLLTFWWRLKPGSPLLGTLMN